MKLDNIFKKIVIISSLGLFLYLVANILYIKSNKFNFIINQNFPKIKKTIFATPAYLELERKYYEVLEEKRKIPSYLERAISQTQFLKFRRLEYDLNTYNYTSSRMKAVGFIEFYNKNLFFINGIGEIKFIDDENIQNFENKHKKIKTNIKKIISDKTFFSTGPGRNNSFNSISDLLIYKDYVYLSLNREIEENCYTKSIIRAKLNFDYLVFEDFFYDKKECRKYEDDKSKYNGHQSGGKMIIIENQSKYNIFNKSNDKILFTIGDYRSNRSKQIFSAQDTESIFGKTILIDTITREYEIFTIGHRNSQGIFYDKAKNIIISTEHGPYGGDEINILSYGKNYGWPVSSYGENYKKVPGDIDNDFYFKKNHIDFGFQEPVIAFTKSIGISDIIKVPDDYHIKWKNSYLATSLNGHVILRFNLNTSLDKVQSIEFINVNDRIRDIEIYKGKIYTILENSSTLTVFSKI